MHIHAPDEGIAVPDLRRDPELHPSYVGSTEGEQLLARACSTLAWSNETFTLFGRTRTVPRLISWAADAGVDYRYAARSHLGAGWPEWLAALRDRLVSDFDRADNHVLLNRYRHGADHMGWHRDDERDVIGDVVVLSLGATRTLRWRRNGKGPSHAIRLEHGSLLLLDGRLHHRLLAAPGQLNERISLTFRQIRSSQRVGCCVDS